MAVLTPEQLANLRTALNILAGLPDGVELRAYLTAGTGGQPDPPIGTEFMIGMRITHVASPIEPPGGDPPPTPVPVNPTMYVVSTNGVFLHTKTDTTVASRVGSPGLTLPFKASVIVQPTISTANNWIWRIIAAGQPNAGLFIAERSTDGATTILSTTKPNP